MQGIQDRVVGLLLGLAAGDRIGGPVCMALRVAESLRDCGGLDVADIGRRYVAWWPKDGFDTGPTAAKVLALAASGVAFDEATILVDQDAGGLTAGCNPAHRNAPLAMCASLPDSEVGRAAADEAQLTHRHPLAGDVAAAVACLCRALIRGMPWARALSAAAAGRTPPTARALDVCEPEELARGGFAPDVLRAAVRFVDQADCLGAALGRAIDFAGPANYCPVLVGSIGGARWGWTQVEPSLVEHHGELVPRLTEVARALAGGWKS